MPTLFENSKVFPDPDIYIDHNI